MKQSSEYKETYTVVFLSKEGITGDLEDCLKVTCRDKGLLEELTGISLNHLIYIFTKQKKTVLIEKDVLIIKSTMYYPSRQGGLRENSKLIGFNRNI
jgi:hypothetical protein